MVAPTSVRLGTVHIPVRCSQACQVQGVWVRPEFRGQGLAAPGMATVVNEARRSISPVVSLYVNDFNAPARATYKRAGFAEVGEFMSVLF